MTVEEGGEAAVVETTPQAAPEAAVLSPAPSKAERDYEAEAAEQGWRPQDEWTGKPENWKDAKTYVEYGEVNNRVFKVEKDYAERFQKLEKVTAKAIERMQAAHDKEVAALKDAKKEAIKAGDVEEVERIEGAITTLQENGIEEAKPKPTKGNPANGSAEWQVLVQTFEAQNPWFGTHKEMTEYAEWASAHNATKNPDISFEDNQKHVAELVRKEFPNYFKTDKTAANGHAAVDGGGFAPGAVRTSGKGFSDLPGEAKRAYENFEPRIKKELSKEQYATEYFNG